MKLKGLNGERFDRTPLGRALVRHGIRPRPDEAELHALRAQDPFVQFVPRPHEALFFDVEALPMGRCLDSQSS